MASIYPVEELVDRLYKKLEEQQTNNQKVILERPVVKAANKKTTIANFTAICNKLNRNVLDVKQYFEKEMNVVSTINLQGSLIITGTFRENNIITVFSSYIRDYVKCKECCSCNTII